MLGQVLVLAQTSDEKRLQHEQWSIEMVLLSVSKHEVEQQYQQISAHIFYIKIQIPVTDEE